MNNKEILQKAEKYGNLMMLRAETECNLYILEDKPHKGWVNALKQALTVK